VARTDLKADRSTSTLRVRSVHWEPGAPHEAKAALDAQLAAMAGWLGLSHVG